MFKYNSLTYFYLAGLEPPHVKSHIAIRLRQRAYCVQSQTGSNRRPSVNNRSLYLLSYETLILI